MALLEVLDLKKHFGGLQAVDGVSFYVESGELLGLIGPNGSGKTTTLALLTGVHKPDSGIIKFNGHRIDRLPIYKRINMGIAIVFQHSRPLKRQTVLDNIKLSLLPDSLTNMKFAKKIEEDAIAIGELVGLKDVLYKYPQSLPFGYIRKMEIAKALALKPKLLLVDEPFAGLTPQETKEVSELILSLKDMNHGIILVDHNVKAVYKLVDRLIALYVGKKIAEGVPSDVIRNEKVKRVFIGKGMEEVSNVAMQIKDADSKDVIIDINIKSLHYGKAEALRDVKIEIKEGEFVSVVGLNGAGKSSLFKAILSLASYEGDVKWRGKSIKRKTTAKIINLGIAFTPETRELFGYMSVEENILFGGFGLKRNDINNKLGEIFKLFPKLKDRRKQLVYTLSGGEQQMLTIARALMQNPSLLILDEPTLGLAPIVLDAISDTISKLHENGLTILLGEQNLHFALKYSNRLYLLENGNITWHGCYRDFIKEVGGKYLV